MTMYQSHSMTTCTTTDLILVDDGVRCTRCGVLIVDHGFTEEYKQTRKERIARLMAMGFEFPNEDKDQNQ